MQGDRDLPNWNGHSDRVIDLSVLNRFSSSRSSALSTRSILQLYPALNCELYDRPSIKKTACALHVPYIAAY